MRGEILIKLKKYYEKKMLKLDKKNSEIALSPKNNKANVFKLNGIEFYVSRAFT